MKSSAWADAIADEPNKNAASAVNRICITLVLPNGGPRPALRASLLRGALDHLTTIAKPARAASGRAHPRD
ncbi:hypothetical protein SSBR45G_43120 [Bradyrhizobium sp. SSBR45G]|nr:hypothetical protein SSBR45G_43120 [Bradyrhizobium sp. SSBR45G]GLH86661.1 hypothetical protein SSBR45R_41210 [Bradyrhizobium sp. SSBR45R]